ncbi:thiamine pyrophosphate-binding protein [Bradyrhizobium sp. HKCCYLS20291]|uniref:thiamine pyrophosphate-binding protein n=1 Tax=Bradyrhizobium sp. HKCCYLS20291 TaxID=3420766 RepID=UPI003EB84CAF
MDAKPPRAADILARRLYEAGCRHAFGMPGGEVLTMVDALEAAGISFHLCKHENSAGFMAEGAYHRTGAPGILVATVGPGLANGLNVVANAQQDRVPLIVISGCVDADEALTYTHQVFDHRAVLAPITKATFTLTADGADIIADKAVLMAISARPGPVHIDIPISVADMAVPRPLVSRHRPVAKVAPAEGTDLTRGRAWLGEASRPVMIVGLDALNDGAEEQIRSFAETFGVPVITTYKAKGILPEDHPLALGGAGLSPLADKFLVEFVKEADLILLVGYDPIEMRIGWRDVWDPAKQRVLEFAAARNDHYMHHATLAFICDVAEGLRAVSSGVKPCKTWAAARAADLGRALGDAFASQGKWGPAAVVETVRLVFPKETVATVDSGAHRILLSQLWEVYQSRGLLQSTGLCTMGCALPLAMGAKIADPSRPVVAFTGDAGLLMVVGELSTMAELRIPVTVIVFVDASLSLIEMKQRGRQMGNLGVDFGRHDFAGIAKAFGGVGVTVSDRPSLERACREAAARTDGFTLIAATIDRRAYDGLI